MMARGMDLTVTGWAGGRSGAASVPRDAVVMGLFLVASALFLFVDCRSHANHPVGRIPQRCERPGNAAERLEPGDNL
jgi:hypothetical protein